MVRPWRPRSTTGCPCWGGGRDVDAHASSLPTTGDGVRGRGTVRWGRHVEMSSTRVTQATRARFYSEYNEPPSDCSRRLQGLTASFMGAAASTKQRADPTCADGVCQLAGGNERKLKKAAKKAQQKRMEQDTLDRERQVVNGLCAAAQATVIKHVVDGGAYLSILGQDVHPRSEGRAPPFGVLPLASRKQNR